MINICANIYHPNHTADNWTVSHQLNKHTIIQKRYKQKRYFSYAIFANENICTCIKRDSCCARCGHKTIVKVGVKKQTKWTEERAEQTTFCIYNLWTKKAQEPEKSRNKARVTCAARYEWEQQHMMNPKCSTLIQNVSPTPKYTFFIIIYVLHMLVALSKSDNSSINILWNIFFSHSSKIVFFE